MAQYISGTPVTVAIQLLENWKSTCTCLQWTLKCIAPEYGNLRSSESVETPQLEHLAGPRGQTAL